MSEKIKNYLGIALILGVVILAFSIVSYVSTYSKSIELSYFRSFSVSGEGKAVAIPDVAQFTFSVITEGGTDIAKLQGENTDKVNSSINFVKSNGVEDKDIKTQSYNVSPRYQYFSCQGNIPVMSPDGTFEENRPCPPSVIVGYSISQTVLVKARDFEKVGGILSGVVENGVNSVSQLSFTIDDPKEFENRAREEAIKEAEAKAKSVAKAAGFRLGRLLSINEGGVMPFSKDFRVTAMGMDAGAESAPAPVIEPGSEDVIINITLTYEIN